MRGATDALEIVKVEATMKTIPKIRVKGRMMRVPSCLVSASHHAVVFIQPARIVTRLRSVIHRVERHPESAASYKRLTVWSSLTRAPFTETGKKKLGELE